MLTAKTGETGKSRATADKDWVLIISTALESPLFRKEAIYIQKTPHRAARGRRKRPVQKKEEKT